MPLNCNEIVQDFGLPDQKILVSIIFLGIMYPLLIKPHPINRSLGIPSEIRMIGDESIHLSWRIKNSWTLRIKV